MNGLARLKVKNYRSLADVSLDLRPINVLFGPNGSGKSTLLDTIWFFRDCAIRGVDLATSTRSHGIGILWDGAEEGARIGLTLATESVEYELLFGLSSGRIEPFPGESLVARDDSPPYIERHVGADKATLYHQNVDQCMTIPLREADKLSLGLFLDFNHGRTKADRLDAILRSVRLYDSRSFFLYRLKKEGSESGYQTRLSPLGDNAWSVLRNVHDRREVDNRFDTIMQYMRKSFPSFDGLLLEPTGPSSVYAKFLEKGRREPIHASGVSNGHLQLLLLLTALFSEDSHESVILFDEPEASLHPWALAVFAEAVVDAAANWKRQVIIATHSPVLISQFDVEDILAAEVVDGRTELKRLSEVDEVQDLLEEYAAGSLFMANTIASQAGTPRQLNEE